MDLSVRFHPFFWVVGDVNGRPIMSYLSLKNSLNDHSLNCLLPHSEQQQAEIAPLELDIDRDILSENTKEMENDDKEDDDDDTTESPIAIFIDIPGTSLISSVPTGIFFQVFHPQMMIIFVITLYANFVS
ncbi:hypothetical protein AVEN_26161-1 [Araneus ventricosus]|uniref:Uncharacterized protein n=1 Tax=Araneus ventricosus TaxID=182803 RepID=A0A4Y2ELU9_ARAVE|nr:hypothetical protein AVEN_26161-1 [Araneus ventricosus]